MTVTADQRECESTRTSWRRAARLWAVVSAFVAVAVVRSAQIDIPLRDPHGKFLASRVALTAAIFAGLVVVDGVLRAGRPVGWCRVAATVRTRWSPSRLVLAWSALLAYHLTYFTYHNLKSWDVFNAPRDDMLLGWDRWLFEGNSPAVLLHELLGQQIAARVLMVWYEAFPTIVVVAFPAAVVLAPRMRDAYAGIAALVWVWILGTASYYAIPSLGPFDAAPHHFDGLPHMVIQDTQARYMAERAHLLAHPQAADAFAQVSAFASLHIGVTAVILGLAWWHRLRRTTIALGVFLAGTTVATVYLGWHFAVDDLAGLLIAALAWWLGPVTVGVRHRPPPASPVARPPVHGPAPRTGDRRPRSVARDDTSTMRGVHRPRVGWATQSIEEEEDMESGVSRRGVLRTGLLSGLGIMVAGSVEAIGVPEAAAVARRSAGYGALVPDPAGVLSLPEGFNYKVVALAGQTLLDSGEPTPSDPDGTAVFAAGSELVLVNNHEVGGDEPYGVPPLAGLTFDPGARGGTTNIVVDGSGDRVRQYVSLAGTHNNCAGGRTPWDTWLTCEETEQRAGGVFQHDHGWTFEVDPFDQAANRDPVPLKFLGRYSHEAVAVDPETSAIYLTEDASGPHGLYYRWTPPAGFSAGKGSLRALALSDGGETAGRLQAMSCSKGTRHIADLSEATHVGTRYKVTWVDVADRLATDTSVRQQFSAGQVTGSRKLEGAYWGDGGAYFVASFARNADGSRNEHDGQVWFYDPATETVTLKTIFGVNADPDSDTDYDGPDNIVVDPNGGLILAEDGEGIQHLVGVTDQGKAYPMARNDVSDSEFTGPTFTADGSILFANIQDPGYVFAITGPWGRPSN